MEPLHPGVMWETVSQTFPWLPGSPFQEPDRFPESSAAVRRVLDEARARHPAQPRESEA